MKIVQSRFFKEAVFLFTFFLCIKRNRLFRRIAVVRIGLMILNCEKKRTEEKQEKREETYTFGYIDKWVVIEGQDDTEVRVLTCNGIEENDWTDEMKTDHMGERFHESRSRGEP